METIRNGDAYSRILREEILPATGCTEPISIAYCAAKAHQVLGMQPTAVTVSASDSILKNVNSVVVPNTNGLKGIRAAVATGIVCGNADKGMQVISSVSDEQRAAVRNFLESVNIDVSCAETDCRLYISITLFARTSYVRVVIANDHSNIVEIMKNGEALVKRPITAQTEEHPVDKSFMNLHDIMMYAENADLKDVQDLLDMQIEYNTAICEEGLRGNYGANIGKILRSENTSDAKAIAKAYAAAGSDARMSGCEMPVAVLCGSGSQGIAAAVPIVCYAKHHAIDKERMYRALILSDLLTVYQRAYVGHSFTYCGAINAGCAAGAGIAYLLGGDENAVARSLVLSISMISGMICDGAKPSCAAKVATAIDTGILGYQIYLYDQQIDHRETTPVPDADAAIRGNQLRD
ncbi:MAG: serine dehydratase subunit alpha family protein [Clostridia bacterium]|nr:serine dehydratase subunit alpha family protein [Clostridia bacterium]